MTNQLILMEPDPAQVDGAEWDGTAVVGSWVSPEWNEFRLDPHTRDVARAGIAAARQALADAVSRSSAREQVAA